jgi:hypothetical protein
MQNKRGTAYRETVVRCGLCEAETGPEELALAVGLSLCPDCRNGDLERVKRRFGLAVRVRYTGGRNQFTEVQQVEIDRASRYDIVAKVRQARETVVDVFWRMVRRQGDPGLDLSRASFDKVRVEPDEGYAEAAERVLQQAGVRRALLELVCFGCEVDLLPTGVAAMIDTSPAHMPEQNQVALRLAVVAVAIERMCRPDRPA